MIEIESPYPAGRVGVATGGVVREPVFFYSFENLRVPVGTRVAGQDSAYLHENRNGMVKRMLETDAQWLAFVDDDNVFPNNMIMRLLAHDKPIVGSLYIHKQYPFIPHVYMYDNSTNKIMFKNKTLASLPTDELLEVDGIATSGMLIKREVFEVMEMAGYDRPFRIDELGDDLGFCHRAKQCGFPVFVDTGVRLGHVAHIPLYPHVNEEGNWCIAAQVSPGEYLEIG